MLATQLSKSEDKILFKFNKLLGEDLAVISMKEAKKVSYCCFMVLLLSNNRVRLNWAATNRIHELQSIQVFTLENINRVLSLDSARLKAGPSGIFGIISL